MSDRPEHHCRVCGWDAELPVWGDDGRTPTFDICSCCGVEFGHQDCLPESTEKYRSAWLAAGAPWRDRRTPHDRLTTGARLARVRAYALDGREMRTLEGVLAEFARALSFPGYFGRNFDALEECLTDLGWLPPMTTCTVYVLAAEHVLADEPGQLATLRSVLDDVAAEWAAPVDDGAGQRRALRFEVRWL